MKRLFIVLLGALSLLACSEGKQNVNQKELLYNEDEMNFKQVLAQSWIFDSFETIKRDFALFHGGVKAEALQLELADMFQFEKGYAVVFDYKTLDGDAGRFVVADCNVMAESMAVTEYDFETDLYFIMDENGGSLEYSFDKTDGLLVKGESGVVFLAGRRNKFLPDILNYKDEDM